MQQKITETMSSTFALIHRHCQKMKKPSFYTLKRSSFLSAVWKYPGNKLKTENINNAFFKDHWPQTLCTMHKLFDSFY